MTPSSGPFTTGDVISAVAEVETSVGNRVTTPASITMRLFNHEDCSGTPFAADISHSVGSTGGGPYTFTFGKAGDPSIGTRRGHLHLAGDTQANGKSDTVVCSSEVTVNKATPKLAVSTTNAAQGGSIQATGTLSGRVRPQPQPGPMAIQFNVFGPSDSNCTGDPVAQTTHKVYNNADGNTYKSDPLVAPAAGTYRWKVIYTGDGNNNGVTVNCGVVSSVVTNGSNPPPPSKQPACQGAPATIVGTGKGETILGTSGSDVIVAKGGKDVVNGKGGNDLICGGGGNDILRGGGGNDVIHGNDGKDDVQGGAGNDQLYGDAGSDRIVGGPGNDKLRGGGGNDGMDGGKGTDTGNGGAGTDVARSIERNG